MPTWNPADLANELHDGVVQQLSALLLQLETYERRLVNDPKAAAVDLGRIMLVVRATLKDVRDIISRLRAAG
ncbi:MAG: histidine kinase [Chloroflexota bacterium]